MDSTFKILKIFGWGEGCLGSRARDGAARSGVGGHTADPVFSLPSRDIVNFTFLGHPKTGNPRTAELRFLPRRQPQLAHRSPSESKQNFFLPKAKVSLFPQREQQNHRFTLPRRDNPKKYNSTQKSKSKLISYTGARIFRGCLKRQPPKS